MKDFSRGVYLSEQFYLNKPFEGISSEQADQVTEKAKSMRAWMLSHTGWHNVLNLCVLLFLLGADFFVSIILPSFFIGSATEVTWSTMILTGLVVGFLKGYLIYGIIVFSMHEGAGHHILFLSKKPFWRLMNRFTISLCRLFFCDPVYYNKIHKLHHNDFGTERDLEYSNFILPKRLWKSLIPFALYFNFNDFLINRDTSYSGKGFHSSIILHLLYIVFYSVLFIAVYGIQFFPVIFVAAFVTINFAFALDRLRHFTEHNLLPGVNVNGSRSFGVGFWGMLIGGGPWGQPCHISHHLAPNLPWYQQILIHFYIKSLLTPVQRKQFLLKPVIGYPMLFWRVIRDTKSFASRLNTAQS